MNMNEVLTSSRLRCYSVSQEGGYNASAPFLNVALTRAPRRKKPIAVGRPPLPNTILTGRMWGGCGAALGWPSPPNTIRAGRPRPDAGATLGRPPLPSTILAGRPWGAPEGAQGAKPGAARGPIPNAKKDNPPKRKK